MRLFFCRQPKSIDPDIIRSMKVVQNVGYAPNPGNRRRNQMNYRQLSPNGDKNKQRNKGSSVPDSPIGRGKTDENPHDLSASFSVGLENISGLFSNSSTESLLNLSFCSAPVQDIPDSNTSLASLNPEFFTLQSQVWSKPVADSDTTGTSGSSIFNTSSLGYRIVDPEESPPITRSLNAFPLRREDFSPVSDDCRPILGPIARRRVPRSRSLEPRMEVYQEIPTRSLPTERYE